ncbi:phosphotransferase [Alkalihalophilus pseudofirmus]|nr:phosphotransferase [Alkalihalophilus pseudofirmus]
MVEKHINSKLRVKWLGIFLGDDWHVTPAGGATGEAYIAQQGDQKLFLKRNSSPFLAVLSAEGIVPKLLWTKRLESGDVITAQRWVNGRELKSYEMNGTNVAQLLGKIHRSSELLDMFKRIGNSPLTPNIIIENLQKKLSSLQSYDEVLEHGLIYLFKKKDKVDHPKFVVCHTDVNHNNWILSESGELYLIDWDGATVADPALDLGLLLYLYIPELQWDSWLNQYGITLSNDLQLRMHWYVVSQTIFIILWHMQRNEQNEVDRWVKYLVELLKDNTL